MSVEERIDRLERENRRLKLAGGGLVTSRGPTVKRFAAAIVTSTVVLICGLTFGQQDSSLSAAPKGLPSNYEKLKHLEDRIGEWTGMIEFFGTPLKGLKGSAEVTISWAMNKNFQKLVFRSDLGARTLSTEGITGWDAAGKQVKSWGFNGDGSTSESVQVEDPDRRLVFEGTIVIPGGRKLKIRDVSEVSGESVTIKRYSGDALLWVAKMRRKND